MDTSLLFRLAAIGAGVLSAYLMQGPIAAGIGELLGPAPDPDTASSAPVIRADLLFALTLLFQIVFAAAVALILLRVTRRKRAGPPGSS